MAGNIDKLLEIGVDVPSRIKEIYDGCTPEEREFLITILKELSKYGESETYRQLWLQDYKEIPVDIDTFIRNDRYLGKITRNGDGIYPYWMTAMHRIFDAGNKYHECVFTGATRIGKTSTAITCATYMLYRLMCLRDPQKFFAKKEESKFSILFFNVTKDLAKSVAYREFNDTLRESPWFQEHGSFSRSERDFYYIPEGGKVVIEYGSDVAHSLGKQVFCLVGSTVIYTDDGEKTLQEIYDSEINPQVLSFDDDDIRFRDCGGIKLTGYVSNTVTVELEDGTIIEGTPEHRLLTRDWKYIQLKDISPGMILAGAEIIDEDNWGIEEVSVESVDYRHYDCGIPVYDVMDVQPAHNFIIRGNKYDIISHNCAIMDEVNFARSGIKDITKAKENIKAIYDSVVARVEGTFRQNGEVWGKVFSVSSKKSDSDFMEEHVRSQVSAGNEHLIVFDKPQWEVLPPDQFNPERFYIAIGDRHHRGFVVQNESEEALDELREQGYKLMQVPSDMRTNFLADFDISLRDLAGIAVPGALSFITQEVLDKNIIDYRQNPFLQDILEIGTRDSYSIEEFFHEELVPKEIKTMDMFIHLDLSLNDDKSGISGAGIIDRKDIITADNKKVSMPVFAHAFSVDIKAPRGDKIPYQKILTFIVWLRSRGFNIRLISRDQFQSEYMAQLLEAQGFDTKKISLDRTPDGYMALRSILLEERVQMLDVKTLQDELIYLQRDSVTGRVDHTVGRAKDMADSFTGAIWCAMLEGEGTAIDRKSIMNAISAVNGPRGVARDAASLPSMFPGLYNNKGSRGGR